MRSFNENVNDANITEISRLETYIFWSSPSLLVLQYLYFKLRKTTDDRLTILAALNESSLNGSVNATSTETRQMPDRLFPRRWTGFSASVGSAGCSSPSNGGNRELEWMQLCQATGLARPGSRFPLVALRFHLSYIQRRRYLRSRVHR